MLYDGGDCIGACSSYQLAVLAGHPAVAVMAGGLKTWQGDLEQGVVELDKNRNELSPNFEAVPTVEEIAGRLDDTELTILDVRRPEEFSGRDGYPCDPRQGHIPGARNLEASCSRRGMLLAEESARWSACPKAPRSWRTATRIAVGGCGDGVAIGGLSGAELPGTARVVASRRASASR